MLRRGLHISVSLLLGLSLGLPFAYSQDDDDQADSVFEELSGQIGDFTDQEDSNPTEEIPEPHVSDDEPAEEIAPSPIASPLRGDHSILGSKIAGEDAETIRERFPDGRVKIERQVTQDEHENYINHGLWVMYSQEGDVVAEGDYEFGERQGDWKRIYDRDDAELFSQSPFNQYVGPYSSTAHFEAGKLHGDWIIRDADDRIISRWSFANGRRHGESVWYHNNESKMRVLNYVNGELNGEFLQYDQNGEPTIETKYMDGRKVEEVVENYEDSQPKQRGFVLKPRLALKTADEWWTVSLAKYTVHGESEKHGKWTTWYPNGQEKVIGEYQFDERSGEFVWYHENGQKWIQAYYSAGKKDGQWTWWHKNGQKSISGVYLNGSPAGRWVWWHETGKVAQRINYSQTQAQAVRSGKSKAQKPASVR